MLERFGMGAQTSTKREPRDNKAIATPRLAMRSDRAETAHRRRGGIGARRF